MSFRAIIRIGSRIEAQMQRGEYVKRKNKLDRYVYIAWTSGDGVRIHIAFPCDLNYLFPIIWTSSFASKIFRLAGNRLNSKPPALQVRHLNPPGPGIFPAKCFASPRPLPTEIHIRDMTLPFPRNNFYQHVSSQLPQASDLSQI